MRFVVVADAVAVLFSGGGVVVVDIVGGDSRVGVGAGADGRVGFCCSCVGSEARPPALVLIPTPSTFFGYVVC